MNTTSVTFLTGSAYPVPDDETPLVAAALTARGVPNLTLRWSDPAAYDDPAATVVIRSTWDYTLRSDDFLATLRNSRSPIWNPVDLVAWNSHKGYLVEMAAAGVPTVPTTLVRPGDDVELGSGQIIVKPAISAGAIGVGRFDATDPAARVHLDELLGSGDVLIQPYLETVTAGEISLIFLGGEFSHAVRKVPAAGDFRVQEEHGGITTAYRPTDAELALGTAATDSIVGPWLYARVDVVTGPCGPQLMELELIEPYLFLTYAPGSSERMAEAILARMQ